MGKLTSRPLYEWEQIGKSRNWDIEKLRQAYWDELTAEGMPGVKEQARRFRSVNLPVDLTNEDIEAAIDRARKVEEGPQIPESPWLGRVTGTALKSVPRAWEEALTMALAGGTKGVPPNVSDIAPMMEAVKWGSEKAQRFVGEEMGLPELREPEKFLSLETIPYMLAGSAGYFTMPIGGIAKGAAPTSRLIRAGLESLGFGGMSTSAGLAGGETPEAALEQGGTTALGVLALNALFGAGGRGLRALRGKKAPRPPARPEGGIPEGTPELDKVISDVQGGGPPPGAPPGLRAVETNLLVPMAERAEARGDKDMAAILYAEYNRRVPESALQTIARQEAQAPAGGQPTGKITQPWTSDLIQQQGQRDLADRAFRAGNTIEEQVALEGSQMRGEVAAAAPPVEPPAITDAYAQDLLRMAKEARKRGDLAAEGALLEEYSNRVSNVLRESRAPARRGERGFASIDLLTGAATKEKLETTAKGAVAQESKRKGIRPEAPPVEPRMVVTERGRLARGNEPVGPPPTKAEMFDVSMVTDKDLARFAQIADERGDIALRDRLTAEFDRRGLDWDKVTGLRVEPPAVAPLNLVRYGYEGGEKIDYRGGDFYLTKERMGMHPEGKGGFEQYGKRIETQFTPKNPLVVETSTEETIGPTVLSKLIGRDKADTFLRNWYENPELAAQQLRELGVSEQQIKNLQKYSESGRLDAQHRFAPSEAAAIQAAKNSGYDSIIYTQRANSTNPTDIESVIVLNKAKAEPPAVAPQAPQTGVPTKGVPPGREGERGFASIDLLTGAATKEKLETTAKAAAGQEARKLGEGGAVPPKRVSFGELFNDEGLRAQEEILSRLETPSGRPQRPMEARVAGQFASFEEQIAKLTNTVDRISQQVEQSRTPQQISDLITRMEGDIRERGGAMTAAGREARRGVAPPVEDTMDLKISQAQDMELRAAATQLVKAKEALAKQFSLTGGATIDKIDSGAAAKLDQLAKDILVAVDQMGTAWGRIGRNRQQTAASIRQMLHQAGYTLNYLRTRAIQERNPLYPNIGRLLAKSKPGQTVEQLVDDVLRRSRGDKKLWSEMRGLSQDEQRQLVRDMIDAWRLNLFSTTSFTLDLFGNVAATTSEFAHEFGTDLARLASGRNAVGLVSLISGMRRALKRAPQRVEQEFGLATPQGEAIGQGLGWVGKKGTFTGRESVASAMIDNAVGLPLYLKGAVDTAFKRWGAWAEIYKQARLAAEKQKVPMSERSAFIEKYIADLKDSDIIAAINRARRMGFSRELSNVEERVYGSNWYKFFAGAFGRWPSQFVRALGEWVGMSPSLWKRAIADAKSGNPQEIMGALTRSLSGIGGLYLLDKYIYPSVDFRSMQSVDEETGRPTRLAGREPFATPIVLLALLKGDFEKAFDGMKYASIPGASFLAGEGGLASSLIDRMSKAVEYRKFDSNSVKYELTRTMNKLIPGQAVLSLLKSFTDPYMRQGLGADIPGVSELLPAKIDPTTGEPIKPTQIFPPGTDIKIPQLGSTPIPGAEIIEDDVSNVLRLYGLMDYSKPRRPVAGVQFADLPREWQNRYSELVGKEITKSGDSLLTEARKLMNKDKIPFGDRQLLLSGIEVYDRLRKGGYTEQQAADEAFATKRGLVGRVPGFSGNYSWEAPTTTRLRYAQMLQQEKKLLTKKRTEAMNAALAKLEKELRQARRTGG